MDLMIEEQIDYEDDEYGETQKVQFQGGGAIPAVADELMGEDDEYDDLYNDVNVGEGFLQLHHTEVPLPPVGVGNGGQADKNDGFVARTETGSSQEPKVPGVFIKGKDSNVGANLLGQKGGSNAVQRPEIGSVSYANQASSQKERVVELNHDAQVRNMAFQGPTSNARSSFDPSNVPVKMANDLVPSLSSGAGGTQGVDHMLANQTITDVTVKCLVNENQSRPLAENGSNVLFVGELHWWTTDAELESIASRYGRVKEIKFYDERASGKSKGYCQVEFFDSVAAAACKDGMNGHVINGRACVVAFASQETLKQMGASYTNKTQVQTQSQHPGRRPINDSIGRGGNMNYQSGDVGRNYGRGSWGRGAQGYFNRGPGVGEPMRGRGGPMGPRNMVGGIGAFGSGAGGGGYGQGLVGPTFGGPSVAMMNPQGMMGSGFDPTYLGPGGGYAGFPGPVFPGMLPSFPPVNTIGLAGVSPHVNPAFFGRGMTTNGMGMMGSAGMDGHLAGMWSDTSMGKWGGEEHDQRMRESSYGGDDGASEYGYGDTNHEKGVRANANAVPRERERGSVQGLSGTSERRHREGRDQDWDRPEKEYREHHYREEKDAYRDHRQRERDLGYEDDYDRGQSSSRPRSSSKVVPEDDHRSRSRDVEYGKRRRVPSE